MSSVIGLSIGPVKEFWYYNRPIWTRKYDKEFNRTFFLEIMRTQYPSMFQTFTGNAHPPIKDYDKWWDKDAQDFVKIDADPEINAVKDGLVEKIMSIVPDKRARVEEFKARAKEEGEAETMSDNVYILGVGMIRFAKHADKSIKQLIAEAMQALGEDVNVDRKDIEAAWFSNSAWGVNQGQHSIRGQVALAPLGIQGIPIINVENACAGASTAIHSAWMSVKAGVYDLVLAAGAEKMFFPGDPRRCSSSSCRVWTWSSPRP